MIEVIQINNDKNKDKDNITFGLFDNNKLLSQISFQIQEKLIITEISQDNFEIMLKTALNYALNRNINECLTEIQNEMFLDFGFKKENNKYINKNLENVFTKSCGE